MMLIISIFFTLVTSALSGVFLMKNNPGASVTLAIISVYFIASVVGIAARRGG